MNLSNIVTESVPETVPYSKTVCGQESEEIEAAYDVIYALNEELERLEKSNQQFQKNWQLNVRYQAFLAEQVRELESENQRLKGVGKSVITRRAKRQQKRVARRGFGRPWNR